jgi:phosphate transport system substrate-binding protein
MPLKPEELDKSGLLQFPMVMGGEALVYNVKGIESGKMVLSGPVIADIFLGKITKWNDPKIAALNPGLKLPDQAIAVVHRSDGSGTTFIFADYLSKVSPEWKSKVGANTSVEWPTGIGGKGNEGVAANVSRTDGAIGYVEYAYAKQNKMSYTLMTNQDGKTVAPNNETFQAAAANAEWDKAPGYYLLLTNQSGAKSWPISGATFILMYKKQDKPENAKSVLSFFDWAYKNGGKMAEELDYVPMPPKVIAMVEKTWATMAGPDGKAVWSANGM